MQEFRKRSTTFAIQFTGDNVDEIHAVTGYLNFRLVQPVDVADGKPITAEVYDFIHGTWIGVRDGDWIAEGPKGENYPIDPEVFELTYEPCT